MQLKKFYLVFAFLAFGAQPAAALPPRLMEAQLVVMTFANAGAINSSVSAAIDAAHIEMPRLADMSLASERELGPTMDKLSEGAVRMVVMVAPRDMEAVARIPGLYPDIHFVLIDVAQPIYAVNVQTVQFKNSEGYYLLGAIAGLSAEKKIAMITHKDDAQDAFALFKKGALRTHPKLEIKEYYRFAQDQKNPLLAEQLADVFREGTSLVFTPDADIANHALVAAKQERKLVVYDNVPPANADTERLLTYMVRRHDLALLDVVRLFNHNQWRAGNTELGVAGGYIDYALNQENVDLFPKEAIDQIEATKDYISQGLLTQAN